MPSGYRKRRNGTQEPAPERPGAATFARGMIEATISLRHIAAPTNRRTLRGFRGRRSQVNARVGFTTRAANSKQRKRMTPSISPYSPAPRWRKGRRWTASRRHRPLFAHSTLPRLDARGTVTEAIVAKGACAHGWSPVGEIVCCAKAAGQRRQAATPPPGMRHAEVRWSRTGVMPLSPGEARRALVREISHDGG
jgi:hypothetical protein